jgi:hypothetical protein
MAIYVNDADHPINSNPFNASIPVINRNDPKG